MCWCRSLSISTCYCSLLTTNDFRSITPIYCRYLALWIVSRNLGQLVGGAINLAINVEDSQAGQVSPSVYIVFMVIECIGFPLAFLLTDPKNVVRSDGTTIKTQAHAGWKSETKMLFQTAKWGFLLLMLPFSFYSFFYLSVYNKYLTNNFSVRARALSSLISPAFCIVGCFGLGAILDFQRWSQRTRAYVGLAVVFVTATGLSVWSIIVQVQLDRHPRSAIDWTDPAWPRSGYWLVTFLPLFLSPAPFPVVPEVHSAFFFLSDHAVHKPKNADC